MIIAPVVENPSQEILTFFYQILELQVQVLIPSLEPWGWQEF